MVITHYREVLFSDSQTAAASLHTDQFAGKNLLVSLFVINISVHTNETGQSARRDISLSSTSSCTQRMWIK